MKYIRLWHMQLYAYFYKLLGVCVCGRERGLVEIEMRAKGGKVRPGEEPFVKGLIGANCLTDLVDQAEIEK